MAEFVVGGEAAKGGQPLPPAERRWQRRSRLLRPLLLAAAILTVNVYWSYVSSGNAGVFAPRLVPGFASAVAWLNLWWGLALLLLLVQTAAAPASRWLSYARLCLRVLAVIVMLRLLALGALVELPPTDAGAGQAVAQGLIHLLNLTLVIAILTGVLYTLVRVYRDLRPFAALRIEFEWQFSDDRHGDKVRFYRRWQQ